MISAEKKKALAAMIQECIGSRTLEQVFKDTGISCAKLHRLRNAKFAKIPDRDFFAALTDPKSHPQNGITLEDFENLINNELFSEIAESKTDAMAAKALGLLASYFIDTSLTSAAKADDTKRYDYLFIKDGKRMAVDFKLVAHKSASLAYIESLIQQSITSCALTTDADIFIIATNSETLFTNLKNLEPNLTIEMRAILLDLEQFEVLMNVRLRK